MQKNTVLPHITVEKLILGGSGLGIDPGSGKKIIISGGAIPGSIVDIRVTKSRSRHIEGQIIRTVKPSPIEETLPPHFQVYGGCRWLPIPYEVQKEIKSAQVREVFVHHPELIENVIWGDIVASPEIYGYRNKVEFSWGKYISGRENVHDEYRFGFHAPGEFDRIVNCTYCALGDDRVNQLYGFFDTFARESRLPTYDTKTYTGFWRHLVIRRSCATDETMMILSVNTDFLRAEDPRLIDDFQVALRQLVSYIGEKGVTISSLYLLHNTGRADIVQGEHELVHGTPTITEKVCGLSFEISPKSFFQTNTRGAEKLYEVVRDFVQKNKAENKQQKEEKTGTLLDLYAGTGTIGMIMADLAEEVYSVEIVAAASADNMKNLSNNDIKNVTVIHAPVEDFLKTYQSSTNEQRSPDVIIIDPPRAGMHPDAPFLLKSFGAREIIYVSCNPATLVRDLATICTDNAYRVTHITPVDMFPHTHHIETVVRLERNDTLGQ